jgi:hypothetical protein
MFSARNAPDEALHQADQHVQPRPEKRTNLSRQRRLPPVMRRLPVLLYGMYSYLVAMSSITSVSSLWVQEVRIHGLD